jgi:hypothetical protein
MYSSVRRQGDHGYLYARTNKPAQAAYDALGWVRDEEFYAYSKSIDV